MKYITDTNKFTQKHGREKQKYFILHKMMGLR